MTRRGVGTRDRILEVALRLFCEQGYDKTTVVDISGLANLTPGALYYHFDSKLAILCALVEPLITAGEDFVARAAHLDHGPASRRVILGEYLDLLIRWRPVVQLVLADPAVQRQVPVAPRLDDQQTQLQALLGGGDRSDAMTAVTAAALGALWRPVMTLDDQQIITQRQTIVDAAMRALGPEHGP